MDHSCHHNTEGRSRQCLFFDSTRKNMLQITTNGQGTAAAQLGLEVLPVFG